MKQKPQILLIDKNSLTTQRVSGSLLIDGVTEAIMDDVNIGYLVGNICLNWKQNQDILRTLHAQKKTLNYDGHYSVKNDRVVVVRHRTNDVFTTRSARNGRMIELSEQLATLLAKYKGSGKVWDYDSYPYLMVQNHFTTEMIEEYISKREPPYRFLVDLLTDMCFQVGKKFTRSMKDRFNPLLDEVEDRLIGEYYAVFGKGEDFTVEECEKILMYYKE